MGTEWETIGVGEQSLAPCFGNPNRTRMRAFFVNWLSYVIWGFEAQSKQLRNDKMEQRNLQKRISTLVDGKRKRERKTTVTLGVEKPVEIHRLLYGSIVQLEENKCSRGKR